MAISGIGIDIEDIGRFRRLSFQKNKEFYQRIFNEEEIAYCRSKKDPAQHFAARFCAKEAFIKASPVKISDYKSMVVLVKKGKPCLLWKGKKALLSLTHDKDKAAAVVILEEI